MRDTICIHLLEMRCDNLMPEKEKETDLKSVFISPPVIGAIISSMVAVALAIIPSLLSNQSGDAIVITPTPPPTQVIAAPTQPLPSVTPLPAQPTTAPTTVAAQPTQTQPTQPPPTATNPPPTATNPPPTATDPPATTPPNVILLFDDVAFTIYNDTQQTLSLAGVQFRSENRRWDATDWGAGLAASFPSDNCLRMRDATTGNRQPPAICGNLLGFVEVGGSALFWLEGDTFEVRQNGTWLATCNTARDRCPVHIPQ